MLETESRSIELKGEIFLIHKDKNGRIKTKRHVRNIVTTAGITSACRLLVADLSEPAFDWIAIGTGTVAAVVGDTALGAEITTGGGARAAGTGTLVTTTVTDDTAQLVVTFTFTASFAVTEAGMFNASSVGDMLSRQVFTAIDVVDTDTLEVTWKIKVA